MCYTSDISTNSAVWTGVEKSSVWESFSAPRV